MGLVEHVEQGDGVLVGRVDQFEVADGELVEPDVQILLDATYLSDMLNLMVLRLVDVMEGSAGGDDTERQILHAEALERPRVEVLGEELAGVVGLEDPVVELGEQHLLSEILLEGLCFALLDDQFHRFEVLEEFVEVFVVAFGDVKFAGGDVEEGDTALFVGKMDGG